MSARHAIIFTVLIAVLLPFYYYVDRPQTKDASRETRRQNLLRLNNIDSVTLTRDGHTIRYRKTTDGKHYELVQPVGRFVPQDLMQALTSLLLRIKPIEVISASPDRLAQFGLRQPTGEMSITSAGRAGPVEIYFGRDNPTGTAIYARIAGVAKIFLLGKNLEYYQTLMFQWVEGEQGEGTKPPSSPSSR